MKTSNGPEIVDVDLLICPGCAADNLGEADGRLVCRNCGASYRMDSGKVFFTEHYFDTDDWKSKSAGFDHLQRRNASYRRIDKIMGPRIRDLRSRLKINGIALNLGGGADNYVGYVNIDLGRYPSVHIVSGLEKIPYKDSSVDLVVSNSVLEHIYDYGSVIEEVRRVLKPGGYFYLCVPSVCMRHHEFDYHRWTMPGLLSLLKEFEIIEQGSCRGMAYAIESMIEALIVFKTRPGIWREMLRRLWLFLSRPIYWIEGDKSPEYEAMSQTIYAIAKKVAAK